MQIDDKIDALTNRINRIEQDIAILKIRADNHETQMEKLEAAITALQNIRDDISNIKTEIAVSATKTNTYNTIIVSTATMIGSALIYVITNWQTIKGLIL